MGDKADRPVVTGQGKQDQQRREILGDHRGPRYAVDAHVQNDYEEKIENHVQNAGDAQKIHRAAAVAHRAHNRRAESEYHVGGHTDEVDPHVQHCKAQYVLRRAHHYQQRPAECNSYGHYDEPADHAQDNRSMNRPAHGVRITGRIIPCHNDARPYRQSCK